MHERRKRIITNVRDWYGRFERPISSLSLVGGFVFDALTLHRVDTLWENVWVVGHLVLVAVFMILIHTQEIEEGAEADPSKAHFWYVNIIQFFFGGILSTYLVFYFRSADLFVSWPFILLLAVAFIANESMKRHFVRLSFQISLLFLSIYSFAIFLIPVLFHKIGVAMFLLSGLVSLGLIAGFLLALMYFSKDKFSNNKKYIFGSIGIISLLINILYFTNLIPPIPLSLKDAGVFHSIVRDSGTGNFTIQTEAKTWRNYFELFPDFKQGPSDMVVAYSAVFSPPDLNITILHEWQHFDDVTERWVTEGKVSLPLVGGREEGFRTYSTRKGLAPGKWRVNVETETGQVIGRMRFAIVSSGVTPPLVVETR